MKKGKLTNTPFLCTLSDGRRIVAWKIHGFLTPRTDVSMMEIKWGKCYLVKQIYTKRNSDTNMKVEKNPNGSFFHAF